jgi:phospholipid/cholesterol/gamma-HCH transport system ATP-binding protein
MIDVKNVTIGFNGKQILNNITHKFEKGKINLIIGGSGSGKTVLVKCMVGLFEVDQGTIEYDGRNFSAMDFRERKPIRREIGMLFQGSALFDSLTVEENVMFPLNMLSGMSKSEKTDRVNFCLQRVNLPAAHKRYPSEISGGMKKRVAIARAIAMNPRYLYCDEPNSGLDPKTSIVIDDLIVEITEEYQMTTVINTHDMNSVITMGENILFIHQGQKWWSGNSDQIMNSDNKELDDFIFASKIMRNLRR